MIDDEPDLPVIQAAYESTCPACDGTIRVGDYITPETTTDVRHGDGQLLRRYYDAWRHDVCPTPRGATTCPRCFLERPCPCEDAQ